MTAATDADRVVVCGAADLAPGQMVAAALGAMRIVVVRAGDGTLYALEDRCLHQGARLSAGRLLDATDGEHVGDYRLACGHEILKCPWHGYEYDVRTGRGLFDRRRGLRRVSVQEVGGQIVAER